MKITGIIILFIVVLFIILFFLYRKHRKWLEQQSPTGVWIFENDEKKITLQFDQGPKEGTYKQVVSLQDGNEIKEFGSWASNINELKLLIMATDQKDHPRFGQDVIYDIRYVGPEKIKIDGPDRPNIEYIRAPGEVEINFDKNVEQKH